MGNQICSSPSKINRLTSKRSRPHQQAYAQSKSYQNFNFHHLSITINLHEVRSCFHQYASLSSLATASAIHLPPSHSLSSFSSVPRQHSRLQSILRIRRPPTPLRHARLEAILELARHLLQTPHAACARRLSPLGFHAPVVCCRDSGLAAWVDFGAGRKEGRERMREE